MAVLDTANSDTFGGSYHYRLIGHDEAPYLELKFVVDRSDGFDFGFDSGITAACYSVAFSPGDNWFVALFEEGKRLRRFNLAAAGYDPKDPVAIAPVSRAAGSTVAFSADNSEIIVSTGSGGTVRYSTSDLSLLSAPAPAVQTLVFTSATPSFKAGVGTVAKGAAPLQTLVFTSAAPGQTRYGVSFIYTKADMTQLLSFTSSSGTLYGGAKINFRIVGIMLPSPSISGRASFIEEDDSLLRDVNASWAALSSSGKPSGHVMTVHGTMRTRYGTAHIHADRRLITPLHPCACGTFRAGRHNIF